MLSDPIISVQGFTKQYGEFTAVNNVSFAIEAGEIFGLLGPNGAGKTTTLECLEGLRAPTSGHLRVAGVDPATAPQKLRDLIGVQLQSAGLPATITGAEAMNLFCAYHNIPPRFELLERLGLKDKIDTQFQDLSTGLKRRLALALAVAHSPPVLFLDEPTAGLDVPSRVELHRLMRELQENGTTIVLATHDMAEAEDMSDRVAILLEGKLVAVDTPMAITAAGAGLTKVSISTRSQRFLYNDHDIPAVTHSLTVDQYRIFFSTNIGKTVQALIQHVEAADDTLLDLRVERPSLEERFLELTHERGMA